LTTKPLEAGLYKIQCRCFHDANGKP
jgi:hypothetical protein